jgi:hypothetical protein
MLLSLDQQQVKSPSSSLGNPSQSKFYATMVSHSDVTMNILTFLLDEMVQALVCVFKVLEASSKGL